SSELDNQILDYEAGFVMSELDLLAHKLNISIVFDSHHRKDNFFPSRASHAKLEIIYTVSKQTADQYILEALEFQKNNSQETKKYAKLLTDDLGIKHYEVQIDSVTDWITENISEKLGINTNWKDHDLSLQNIQARARSPIVWFMANLKNHLLISTGNRSEASVGYTTMDGDSSGSICPIAGVSKEFILIWLDHLHKHNEFKENFHSLEYITHKRPTAELKPLSELQEDEKDLMPYPILQKIEYEYVYNGRREDELFLVLKDICRDITEEELNKYINKFISYFKKSQWKRERLPPSFHLDEYGLDPKSSFRFPILS
ncbi:MAG: NAD(+) synthase, partial [Spirochaetia bacterium]|nr:NAD(+) synthase [Spirochaetia bacterium]